MFSGSTGGGGLRVGDASCDALCAPSLRGRSVDGWVGRFRVASDTQGRLRALSLLFQTSTVETQCMKDSALEPQHEPSTCDVFLRKRQCMSFERSNGNHCCSFQLVAQLVVLGVNDC